MSVLSPCVVASMEVLYDQFRERPHLNLPLDFFDGIETACGLET
jgi:hypothetical protein